MPIPFFVDPLLELVLYLILKFNKRKQFPVVKSLFFLFRVNVWRLGTLWISTSVI